MMILPEIPLAILAQDGTIQILVDVECMIPCHLILIHSAVYAVVAALEVEDHQVEDHLVVVAHLEAALHQELLLESRSLLLE